MKIFFIYPFIIFVALEIFSRVAGRYISYGERTGGSYGSPFNTDETPWDNSHEPHQLVDYQKSEFSTKWMPNSEGINEKELSLDKTGKRILILGDSFTEGVGASNDSSYPRILETMIHDSLDSTVEVINAGLSSADVFTEYKLLTGKMLKYNPDVILITFNSTDIYEYTIRGGFERFIADNKVQYRQPPWFEGLYASSYLVRRIVRDVFHYDSRFLKEKDRVAVDTHAVQQIAMAIDSFSNLCREKHIALGIVFHPMYPEFPVHSYNYQNLPLIEHCQKQNIAYVDEAVFLEQQHIDSSNIASISWQADGHFNRKGYELLARCAYQLFDKNKWLIAAQAIPLITTK